MRHAVSASPSPAPTRSLTADKPQALQAPSNDGQTHASHAARQAPRASPAAPNGPPSRISSPVLPSKLSSDLKAQASPQVQNGLRPINSDAALATTAGLVSAGNAPEYKPPTALATNGVAKVDSALQQKSAPGHSTSLTTPQPQASPVQTGASLNSEVRLHRPNEALKNVAAEPPRSSPLDDRSTLAPAVRKSATPIHEQKPQQHDRNQQALTNGVSHSTTPASAPTPTTQKATTTTPTIQSRPSPVPKLTSASHQGPAVKKIAMSTSHRQTPNTASAGAAVGQDSVRTAMSAPPKPANDSHQAKPTDAARPSQAAQSHHVALKTGPNTHAMPALTERPYQPLQLGPSENSHQRSVSEVLALPPVSLLGDVHTDSGDSQVGPITPISQSSKARPRGVQKSKGKDRSKMAMVVFGKQVGQNADKSKVVVPSKPKSSQVPSEDYFTPLFVQAFASNSKWMKPLDQILGQAHKTVSTPDSYTQLLDNHACRVLRRVYHLQHHDKWSLRQPKRCPEPIRPASHWDVLLKEMKWMRTDFRQERKWKTAAARSMAHACADWVASTLMERKEMQVAAMIPPKESTDIDMEMLICDGQNDQIGESQPTPDLVPSAESESILDEEESHQNIFETVAPSAIFALEQDDLVFPLQHSPSTDRLLEELPMYGSPLAVPKGDIINPDFDPDAAWRKPALPLSRFVEGEIRLTSTEPPQRRSRYQHALEDEDDEDGDVVFGGFEQHPRAQPQNPDVALFRTENRVMRDRLHAGHQFRPPNEHSMPFQTFYESRSPSQWTQSEDDDLKSLVREYSYNWSLISSNLATKSIFVSGAERRTPWECFERWVMLEGLPHDMQKTQYFKLWQNRIESAQQLVRQQAQNAIQQSQQQQQNQQQQQPNSSNSGPVTPLPRRRQSIPLKVERRRNQKHLTMIDAMRKLAKKRETAQAKQQQAASLAAMRKAQSTEAAQPRQPTKTPREYSIMRWERDQAMAERLAERVAQHQQRQDAQRRVRANIGASLFTHDVHGLTNQQAALQARAQQGQAAQLAAQAAAQNPQGAVQLAAAQPNGNAPRPNTQGHAAVNGQARARVPMPTVPNGNSASPHPNGGLVPPMHPNGAGQVQMPIVNGQARMAMPNQQANLQLLMQAQRIQEQQRQSVQIQQQQQQQSQHPQQQPQQALQHVQMHQQHQTHQATSQQQQQQQLQLQQAQQANMQMQNSPPAMRAATLAGLNQKNFLNNPQAQALIASMNAANGAGMSTPPTPGFNLPTNGTSSSTAASPGIPQQTHQTYVSQLQHIESQLRQSQPHAPQEAVRQMARQLLQNRQNTIMQSAMNAAAGGANGQTAAANGPHQYAQLLRAQQQQQQAQAAAQQQQPGVHNGQGQAQGPSSPALSQQTPQQRAQQAQHQSVQLQRNPSGSATPTPAATK